MVWAVAKGSFLNKLILVPAALAISAFAPPLITVLLVIGGLYLCFEGAEKIHEKWFHSADSTNAQRQERIKALVDTDVDLVALEQNKIKGAIRTDFILSAEIVVIALGTVQHAAFQTQVMVVSSLAIAITVGVYGLVAAIVKLDDLGLYLLRKSVSGSFNQLQRSLGRGLLIFAPLMMKALGVIGTVAMFLVGGGILTHSFSWLHHFSFEMTKWLSINYGNFTDVIAGVLYDGLLGLIAGFAVLASVNVVSKIREKQL